MKKANIVVIGAGIVGTSVAYHLAQRGVQDIVLIDKGDPDNNDGSTSHAPGGLRTLTISNFFTTLGYASRQVYDKLPLAIEGQEQFFRVGFIQVANHKERFNSYQRIQEMGLKHGIESHLLTPNEIAEKLPMIDPSTVYGGMFVPSSGTVKTSLIATSMRREGEKTGNLSTIGYTQVTEVVERYGRVQAVLTDNPECPRIECEQVVLASNIWAPILCKKLGVPMPLFPGEHQYIFTHPTSVLDPFKHVESGHPIATMDDISVYFRQHDDCVGIGSYHHEARLVDPEKLRKVAKYPFTPEDFTDAWRLMKHHMPGLNDTDVSHGFNGLFSFTADHYPIIGESHVKGFWTAVGAWLSFASEVGNVLARWMTKGDPGMDMSYADINRFHPHQSNDEFLRRQSKYYYEIGFDILHPNEVASSVRNLRFSPYHDQMEKLGGEMVPLAAIESPWYYKSNEKLLEKYGSQFPHRTGYDGTSWSPIIGCEHIAMRENVGLMDWSAAIGPIEVSGLGALHYLNYLTSNQMDKPVGRISYTLMLSPSGGIKRDLTVLRLAEDRFWILTGKGNMPAEIFWMKQYLPTDGSVTLQNRSEEFVSLGLWGPNARKVLEKVSPDDLSNEAFPFYTAKEIGVGMIQAIAIRISYAGELGYELYAPVSFGQRLWDTLWEAGEEFDMTPVGLAALFSLRVEKGYKLTGSDMTIEHTPYESNMGWMVDLKKDDFVGKNALVRAKAEGRKKKLVTLVFDDPKALAYGYEPVFIHDEVVGYVTSGEFGYCVGKYIALAYLPIEHTKLGTAVSVRYTGNFYTAVVDEEVQFDPNNERLRA